MSQPSGQPRPRILSGVQPTGLLHLGNYFGAIQQHVALQDVGECFYFIANYHSLTSVRDPAALRAWTQDVALTYLALGLDPERTVFYRQSDVPEVCELTWLLTCVTGMGLLERAHSFKEKVSKGLSPSAGLFLYPVLMAADILGPQTDLVPVGQDQDQHVEMARDMAQAFHQAFGCEVFRLPKSRMGTAPRVSGTTFEKGAVVQVNTALRAGEGFDARSYAEALRQGIGGLVASADAEAMKSTEEIEAAVAEAHGRWAPGVEVAWRQLRTVSEMPASGVNVSRDGALVGVEFWVQLDRVVFQTRDRRRVAAKMSKSYGNTIPIFAEGRALKKAVMGIETRLVDLADPLDPDEDLVLALFKLFADPEEVAEMEAAYRAGGFGYGNAKKALLEKIEQHFASARQRRRELEADPALVDDVLAAGAARARAVIGDTVARARTACGL